MPTFTQPNDSMEIPKSAYFHDDCSRQLVFLWVWRHIWALYCVNIFERELVWLGARLIPMNGILVVFVEMENHHHLLGASCMAKRSQSVSEIKATHRILTRSPTLYKHIYICIYIDTHIVHAFCLGVCCRAFVRHELNVRIRERFPRFASVGRRKSFNSVHWILSGSRTIPKIAFHLNQVCGYTKWFGLKNWFHDSRSFI